MQGGTNTLSPASRRAWMLPAYQPRQAQLSSSSPTAILVSLAQLLVPVCAEQPCCAKLGNRLSLDSPRLARSFCSHAPLQGPPASPSLPSASLLARLRPSTTLPNSTLASQHSYYLAVQNYLKLWINKWSVVYENILFRYNGQAGKWVEIILH